MEINKQIAAERELPRRQCQLCWVAQKTRQLFGNPQRHSSETKLWIASVLLWRDSQKPDAHVRWMSAFPSFREENKNRIREKSRACYNQNQDKTHSSKSLRGAGEMTGQLSAYWVSRRPEFESRATTKESSTVVPTWWVGRSSGLIDQPV